jgi:hypothetical protein
MDLHEADLYSSHMEEQLPYHAIKNEYDESLLLKEALLFMDEAFPEWKTNAGVGKWAAEFIHTSLDNLAHLQNEETKYSSFEILKGIYEELVSNYQRMKANYSVAILDSIILDFDIANEDFDYENRHLSVEDNVALYKAQLAEFKIEYLKKVTFNFDF